MKLTRATALATALTLGAATLAAAWPATADTVARTHIAAAPMAASIAPAATVAYTGPAYKFLVKEAKSTDAAGKKTGVPRWDPCTPIKVFVNPAGLPTGGLGVIKTILKRMSMSTGYKLYYAGPTDIVPWNEVGKPAIPFLDTDPAMVKSALYIAWATPTDDPGLAGTVAGDGGLYRYDEVALDSWRIMNGGVTIDKTAKLPMTTKKGRTIGYLLTHEIAHALNLNHIANPRDTMYPELPPTTTAEAYLTPGASRGLKKLAAMGCFSIDGGDTGDGSGGLDPGA